jgi:hypothetical protein
MRLLMGCIVGGRLSAGKALATEWKMRAMKPPGAG